MEEAGPEREPGLGGGTSSRGGKSERAIITEDPKSSNTPGGPQTTTNPVGQRPWAAAPPRLALRLCGSNLGEDV